VQTLDLCGCVGRHHAGGDEENSHEQ
jgi:hypothetical protein